MKDDSPLQKVAQDLEINPDDLRDGMCTKGFKAAANRSSNYTLSLDATKASDQRDALAKLIYTRLFAWVLDKLNAKLTAYATSKNTKSIYLFDIFGFESIRQNSLEQMNINFANEALHQLFLDSIFKFEQQVPKSNIFFLL